MIFTGKNKNEFEKWFFKKYGGYIGNSVTGNLQFFYSMPFEMQQGVILEYLDSVDLSIGIVYYKEQKYSKHHYDWRVHYTENHGSCPTRKEALTEAFKKANEILNNRL